MTFEELLEKEKTRIETYVKYRVSDRTDREDLLQEIFLQAFEKFETLRNRDSFRFWIMAIARNRVNDYYREQAREKYLPLDDEIPSVSINRSVNETVRETLRALPEHERKLLYLCYWEGYTQKQIAEILKIPEGTVKSRLFTAKHDFRQRYPKEEKMKKKMPEYIPDYVITKIDEEPFETEWKELMGWFLIPEEGNHLCYAIYDFPEKKIAEEFELTCSGKAQIHGLQGVKVEAIERSEGKEFVRHFIAQLTDTHCRYLAESHMEDGIEKYYTFMDGEAFTNNWGFGPDNIGNEIHLKQKGEIERNGDKVVTKGDQEVMDVTGRYKVSINGKAYDTICLMDIGAYDENTISEQYIDRNGRTILWRRFNKNDDRWLFDGFEKADREKLTHNEKLTVNGQTVYHWYDCITDYIL